MIYLFIGQKTRGKIFLCDFRFIKVKISTTNTNKNHKIIVIERLKDGKFWPSIEA